MLKIVTLHLVPVESYPPKDSILLSSLNLTIYIQNLNDNPPKFLIQNFTTLYYFFYPTINTVLYRIHVIDKDESILTYEIINDTSLTYRLRTSSNSTELILMKSINNNHEFYKELY
ncbi:unnamed protein product [Adineta steineri]|uniref:Cadherin domain-containing protein n=1 Tax=Adineta steineri TaxID=433720 RepID=A0A820QHA4_9BILA|nr:unnamed protein product [Adineta steineri]